MTLKYQYSWLALMLFGMQLSAQIGELKEWLILPFEQRPELHEQDFAHSSINGEEAIEAEQLLYEDHKLWLKKNFGEQWQQRELNIEGAKMPFYIQRFGKDPNKRCALIISLHGGGGAPKKVNDQQYENQKHLYDKFLKGKDVIYLAPRAPGNTWNLWHECRIDQFINILIQMAILEEGVNPDRVYLIGYSAGGDGVYQLSTRMADRFAGASMMAGHPNEVTPFNLRNIAFALHMGAEDSAYSRNAVAKDWGVQLDSLSQAKPRQLYSPGEAS